MCATHNVSASTLAILSEEIQNGPPVSSPAHLPFYLLLNS
jgi:poly(A) polymerase Pap1